MITRNINDDNTLAYLFNGNSKAVKNAEKKASDDLDKAVGRIDGSIDDINDEIERLDSEIALKGIPAGGNQGMFLVKASSDDYDAEWISHGMDLLWENASPMSTFEAQTITVDLVEYQFIKIGFKWYTGDSATATIWQEFKVGEKGRAQRTETSAYICNRDITVNSGSVVFANCMQSQGTGSSGAMNQGLVPIAIYGIRGGT